MSRRNNTGCWTCRLRRKRCDESRPACDICTSLNITCHYDAKRPEWMDGGVKQEIMAEQLKLTVKAQAPFRRRGERLPLESGRGVRGFDAAISPTDLRGAMDYRRGHPGAVNETAGSGSSNHSTPSTPICKQVKQIRPFQQEDSVLLTFYWEQLLPFFYPFYRPSILEGGRAWIIDLVISSPVVRQATLAQSAYFFALLQETPDDDRIWQTLLRQANDAFIVLQEGVHVINSSGVVGHMHGAVRIMAAIMQVQRFEILTLCFDNCHAHLTAALAIFQQIMQVNGGTDAASFPAALSLLGPSLCLLPVGESGVLSAEQAAFRFSTALLLRDDIIASTILQGRPTLSEYHSILLSSHDSQPPLIDCGSTVGCQNWVLVQIGEIAALDAWKQESQESGRFDVLELAQRALSIQKTLEAGMEALLSSGLDPLHSSPNPLEALLISEDRTRKDTHQATISTRIWAHAAFLYLSIITSGYQPASPHVRHHVECAIDLLTNDLAPRAMLRTVVWPFCVVGCLAETPHAERLKALVEGLHPPAFFSPVRQAWRIVQQVWRDREEGSVGEFAMYFREGERMVLLV